MNNEVLVSLNGSAVEKLLEMTTERIFQLEYSVENLQDKINDLRKQLEEAQEKQKEDE